MGTRIYYSVSIPGDGTRCDQWNVFTLTSNNGSTVPSNAAIVNAGWDFCTVCKNRYEGAGSPEFGVYALAISGGPYTGTPYDGSEPSDFPSSGAHVGMSHTASEADYSWGYPDWTQGGNVEIKLTNNKSWTRCDSYNNTFQYNKGLPGTLLIGQRNILVKAKFGNKQNGQPASETYVQDDNYGNRAITVWVEYETFSGSWSSDAALTCSQNAYNVTATRSGSYSVSHGSVKYQYYGATGHSGEITDASWTESLSASQLGQQQSYSVIPVIKYGWTDTNKDAKSTLFTPSLPSLAWSPGAHIEFDEASNKRAKITRDGSASDPNGFSGTVYYRLFCESTRKNSDGDAGNEWLITPVAYDRTLTYKLDAYFVVGGTTYYSGQLTVQGLIADHDTIKVYHYNRATRTYEWIECVPMYCSAVDPVTGEATWVECKAYIYHNGRWVELSHS